MPFTILFTINTEEEWVFMPFEAYLICLLYFFCHNIVIVSLFSFVVQ